MGRVEWVLPGRRVLRGGATITAVTATAAVLLAGCGTGTAGQPASGPRASGRPAVAASTRPAAGPGASGPPPAGSRAGARALASQLLAGLVLPAGARPVTMRALPWLLRQPQAANGGTGPHEADIHRVYLLSQPMPVVQDFLRAHVPAGMRTASYGQLADPGSATTGGQTAGPGNVTMESVGYQPRSLPAGINEAELDTAVIPAPNGGSLLRADAAVIWYPARPAAEPLDPARYRAATVSITLFNPRWHTLTRTVTSRGVIGRLAGLVNRLPGAPYQPANCPAILAGYQVIFIPTVPAAPRVVVSPSGCLTVGVNVGGVAQPSLWGDTGLIAAAKRLLHVKSLLAWGALAPDMDVAPVPRLRGPRHRGHELPC